MDVEFKCAGGASANLTPLTSAERSRRDLPFTEDETEENVRRFPEEVVALHDCDRSDERALGRHIIPNAGCDADTTTEPIFKGWEGLKPTLADDDSCSDRLSSLNMLSLQSAEEERPTEAVGLAASEPWGWQLQSPHMPMSRDYLRRFALIRRAEVTIDQDAIKKAQLCKTLAEIVQNSKSSYKTHASLISLAAEKYSLLLAQHGTDLPEHYLHPEKCRSFCSYACDSNNSIIVQDLQEHRLKVHPLVSGHPHLRFYAGAPIFLGNVRIGALCIFDTDPRPNFSLSDCTTLVQLAAMASEVIGRFLGTPVVPAQSQ